MVLSWMQMQWNAVQWQWIHEISQSALALAVATLGIVILLELASIARLRRTLDAQMQRVFEQLDLLRGDNLQLLEARREAPAAPAGQRTPAPAARANVAGVTGAPEAAPALGAGEARLLAALTAARTRLGRGEGARGRA